ncbi:DUF6191 domain-containing protein [Streptomyces malaysiense]|uniref:Regulatory protein n=1 Tax=Streptomyces malaysiense TaxID=1428626 RepID=A0A1J4Q709_9ACTN|nr:DUF6191 domain-containing protein [Streptomyces malaysiense]OIK28995.1 hypothetical protein VT52_002640 [Streptomyces malaysiense]
MFDAFSELFTPGRKHTRDEQNRLELTREEAGDSDPGRGPIDLTSGKAVIRLSARRPAGAEPEREREEPEPEREREEPEPEREGERERGAGPREP